MLCSTAFFLQQSSRQIYYQFINNVKCLYWDQTSFGVYKHMLAILIHSVFCTTGKSWICFFLPWIFQIRNLHSHWCAKSCLSFVSGSSVCSHLSFPWDFSFIPKKVHGGFLPCSEFDQNCFNDFQSPKNYHLFSLHPSKTPGLPCRWCQRFATRIFQLAAEFV